VANVVSATDTNLLSVLQYAVDVLQVDHIVVCGHYGCGGVQAVLEEMPPPPLGAWLHEVLRVKQEHQANLDPIEDKTELWRRLCELNVQAQIDTLASTHTVQRAWERGEEMVLHGLMFDIETGMLSNMHVSRFGPTM
jgi:carbonic anhydrase